jgi:protein-S-isoprenylcysteine O-methyltransferase Ste14
MFQQLFYGLTLTPIANFGDPYIVNLLLTAQFPILHSWLLSKKGRGLLSSRHLGAYSKSLAPTFYTTIASLQLILTFGFWQPSKIIIWQAAQYQFIFTVLYLASWMLLGWSMFSAGLSLQTGAIGWLSALKDKTPQYPKDFPTSGLFTICRQPIYLSFALIMWSGPIMTADKLFLATIWSGYCFFGPLFKEKRFSARWGRSFKTYQDNVPYFFPFGWIKSR